MTTVQWYIAKACAIVLWCIGLFAWGHHLGSVSMHDKWQASITADAVAQANRVHASDIVTKTVVTQYVDRMQVVLTQGATITKEVKVYVTHEADARCTVPVGVARVLNAAAGGKGLDTNPAIGAYDAALGTPLSDVTNVIADNFITCRADQERLRSLQQWITDQQQAVKTKGP